MNSDCIITIILIIISNSSIIIKNTCGGHRSSINKNSRILSRTYRRVRLRTIYNLAAPRDLRLLYR